MLEKIDLSRKAEKEVYRQARDTYGPRLGLAQRKLKEAENP